MKKINFPLWIGTIVLIILLLVSLFPEQFTDIDPNARTPYTMSKKTRPDGYQDIMVYNHPAKPDDYHMLGTDEAGRDVYSRLIYGTKPTLKAAILITLYRLLLAIPIGLAAGIGVKAASSIIKFFNTTFTAIPLIFISVFLLNNRYIVNLSFEKSTVVFAIVLSLFGWGKLGRQVEEKASKIMSEDFIEGKIAVGKSKLQIATQNVFPHLIQSLVSFIFLEIGLVIFLLAQLSIFGVFIGPKIPIYAMGGGIRWWVGVEPEWGSMLGQMPRYTRIGRYWVGLYPGLAFAVAILGFNLTGEGLRIEFEKRNSKAASIIRKFVSVFSPKIYVLYLHKFTKKTLNQHFK